MRSIYVIGIAQFIYGLTISPSAITKAYLVRVDNFEPKGGNRSFTITAKLMKDICSILNIDFKIIELKHLPYLNVGTVGDLVDIALLIRLNRNSPFVKPVVLALQVEHVSFMRPSLFGGLDFRIVKRFDLIKNIIWPLKIREFYTLAPTPKRGVVLRERNIDLNILEQIRNRTLSGLKLMPEYRWLNKVPFNDGRKSVIVLPLAIHFGGSQELNLRVLTEANQKAESLQIDTIVIKNHPSDNTDYSTLVGQLDLRCETLFSMRDEKLRTFPLELLIACFSGCLFVGAESTIMMTSITNSIDRPVIVEDLKRRSKKHRDYDIGAISDLYDSERIFI